MSNKISLENLKFNPIRKTFEGGIEVYNLTPEMKNELSKIIFDNLATDKQEVDIDGKTLLIQVLPLLTNIYLPDDDVLINEIIDNPSEILEDVVVEVSEMVTGFFAKINKEIGKISSMPENEREKYFKSFGIKDEEELVELTEEEKLKFEKYSKKLMH